MSQPILAQCCIWSRNQPFVILCNKKSLVSILNATLGLNGLIYDKNWATSFTLVLFALDFIGVNTIYWANIQRIMWADYRWILSNISKYWKILTYGESSGAFGVQRAETIFTVLFYRKSKVCILSGMYVFTISTHSFPKHSFSTYRKHQKTLSG